MKKVEEVWKDIPGYEGLYQVSNLGRVYSIASKKNIKPLKKYNGYSQVGLFKNKKYSHRSIHRLVMLTFIGASNLQVNHINGVKDDNRLENLEYCNQSYNMEHAYRTGLQKKVCGNKHYATKITEEQVKELKENYIKNRQTHKQLALLYKVSRQTIGDILSGRKRQNG